MRKRSKKKLKLFPVTVLLIVLGAICYFFAYKYIFKEINIRNTTTINIDEYINENGLYNVELTNNEYEILCSINDEEYKECSYELEPNSYNINIKHKDYITTLTFEVKQKIKGSFTSNIDMLDTYYIAKNGTKQINLTFDYPEEFDKTVAWTSTDTNIASVENGIVHGLENGETTIKATLKDGNSKIFNFYVTDIINPPTLNNYKQYLPCKFYTKEQNDLLDKILASRVKEAGEGTRGGVVAAARFINLEFQYQVKYFNEPGRLGKSYGSVVDAQGRFYHKGLYLHESRYDILDQDHIGYSGPNVWGCNLYDIMLYTYKPNGFTCSGFVTWAMYNGGYDVGDVGAGDYPEIDGELSDLGPHIPITYDYMKNGNYKVGDFIARDAHAALIIGISDTTIYTAEALPPKLEIWIYERYSGIVNDPNLTYVIEMGNLYPNGEGVYTNMW